MAEQVTTTGSPRGISVDSSGNVWLLMLRSSTLQMWKYNGTSWSNVGTNQGPTDVHGKKGTTVGSDTGMDIDSNDLLHVYDRFWNESNDLAYATFNTSTNTWSSWVEAHAHSTAWTASRQNILVDGSDDVWITHVDQTNKNVRRCWVVTNRSGSWVATQVDPGDASYWCPNIAEDSSGHIHVWYQHYGNNNTYFREWTPGGGWGTNYSNSQGVMLWQANTIYTDGATSYRIGTPTYNNNAVYQTSSSGGAIATPVRQTDTTSTNLAFDDGDSYVWNYSDIAQGYDGTDRYMLFQEEDATVDSVMTLFKYAGSNQWERVLILDSESGHVSNPHIAYNRANASNYGSSIHCTWARASAGVWYYEHSGTPVSSSSPALILGGGTPSDSQSAYMVGRDRYSTVEAFLEGYTDGVSVRTAWMNGKPSSIPAYIKGTENWYFDVVQFDAQGSTGTHDITGSLGGLQPSLAFFMGVRATANDTETDDYGFFYGLTDGTNDLRAYGFINHGDGTSYYTSGGVSTGACGGFSSSSGGSFSFDSWITNGVRVNWTAAAGSPWICAAMLIAADVSDPFSTYQGSYSITDASTNDIYEETGVGFKPDMLIFFNPQHLAGFGIGIAIRDKDTDAITQWSISSDHYSGYFAYSGVKSSTSSVHNDGIYGGNNDDEEWKVESFDEDGFTLKCVGNDGAIDTGTHQYIAIKWDSEVFKAGTGTGLHGYPTGNDYVSVGFRPGAIQLFSMYGFQDYSSYPSAYNPHGFSFFDSGAEVSGSTGNGYYITNGNTTYAKSVAHDSKAVILYSVHTGTKYHEATLSSIDGGGFTLNYSTAQSNSLLRNWFVFGTGYNIKSTQKAYLFGHQDYNPAFVRGSINTSSSVGAFFNVVDAQDSQPAYLDGLNPTRSSTPAYTSGADNPLMIMVPFTCDTSGGTQAITDERLNDLTPKAAIVWTFEGTDTSNCLYSHGVTDGTNTYGFGVRTPSDTSAYFNTSVHRDKKLIIIGNGNEGSPGILASAGFSSWTTNGMNISWTGTPAEAFPGVVLFFAGSELSADVGQFSEPAGSGPRTQDITAPGFEPDLLMHIHSAFFDWDGTLPHSGAGTDWEVGWAINDNNSPYPTQWTDPFYHAKGSPFGQYITPYMWGATGSLARPQNDVDRIIGSWQRIEAFLSTGFRKWYQYDIDPSGPSDYVYLAIKFDTKSRRKAHFAWENVEWRNTGFTGITTIAPKPYGSYHVIPENMILLPSNSYQPESGTHYANHGNWIWSYIGGGTRKTYAQTVTYEFFNTLESNDSFSKATEETSYTHIFRDIDPDTRNWVDYFKATATPTRNGFEIDVDYNNLSHAQDSATLNAFKALIIGIAEYYDSQPAYIKGQKVDWPSRTPRGCYLEGEESSTPASSSTSAFIQVITTSNTPAFLEGYTSDISSNAAYARGQLSDSANQECYLEGSTNATDIQAGYTKGQQHISSGSLIEGFLWGQVNVTSSLSTYLNGTSEYETSSIPAWLRSGWDVQTNQRVFIQGVDVRSDQSAFLEGENTYPSSAISAYLEGAGSGFPFTDDFTGSDEDSWNPAKWVTSEDG